MSQILSVSQLATQIKSYLESTFSAVTLRGEISRITFHSSGHVYFDVKDEAASLSCIIFKSNYARLKFRLEQGMSIIASGALSVYTQRGTYSLNCFSVEPDGRGALSLAYEQLKKELDAAGYFAPARKKPLPRYPRHLAFVTSSTSAALQDMLRVASKRFRAIKITQINTLVQGDEAAQSIVRSLRFADSLGADVIVLARGGGSIEDLWCFNERAVADAIFAAKTPVVSAIGHEIDYVISDFVADLRAPTPSAAMELVLPDFAELIMSLSERRNFLDGAFSAILEKNRSALLYLKDLFGKQLPQEKHKRYKETLAAQRLFLAQKFGGILGARRASLAMLAQSLDGAFKERLLKKQTAFELLRARIQSLDPAKADRVDLSRPGTHERLRLEDLKPNEEFNLTTAKFTARALCLEKNELKT